LNKNLANKGTIQSAIVDNGQIAKHQFFDTTDLKFDKYYYILFFLRPCLKNNHLKFLRVLFFDLFWQEFCGFNN